MHSATFVNQKKTSVLNTWGNKENRKLSLAIILLNKLFHFLKPNLSSTSSCGLEEIAGKSIFPTGLTKFAPRPDRGYTPCNDVLSLEMSLNRNFVMLIFLKTCTFCHSMWAYLKDAVKEHLSFLTQQFVKCRSPKDCFHPFHINSYIWRQLTVVPTTQQTLMQQVLLATFPCRRKLRQLIDSFCRHQTIYT